MTGAVRPASAVLVARAIVGCSAIQLPWEVAGPTIAEGTLIDETGAPVAGVILELQAEPFGMTEVAHGSVERRLDGAAWVDAAPSIQLQVARP